MSDIILEIIRVVILLYLLVYLTREGKKRSELCRSGWYLIITGFALLLFGSVMDITDNFESLNRFVVIGDTPVQAVLEKMVGFMGGFLFVAIGLIRWIPALDNLKQTELLNKKLKTEIGERRLFQRALRESDLKYKKLFDSSYDAIILTDPKTGKFAGGNPAAIKIFGVKREVELLETGPGQASPEYQPDGQLSSKKATEMMAIATKKGSHFFEWTHKRLDGTEFPATVLLTEVKYGSGVLQQATVRDISKEKAAQKQLEETNHQLDAQQQQLLAANQQLEAEASGRRLVQERLDLALKASNTGLWDMEMKTGETYYSPTYYTILGYDPDEFPAAHDSWHELMHPDDVAATDECLKAHLLNGTPYSHEFRMKGKDGSWQWIHSRGDVVERDENNEPIRMTGTHNNITERKQVAEALKKSKALLNATGKIAKVGGWELELEPLALNWTDGTKRIHDLPLDYMPDLDEAINFYHPDDQPKIKAAVQSAIEHGEAFDLGLRVITAKGREIWVQEIGKPHILNGKTVKVSGTFQDITERKQAEENMNAIFGSVPVGMMLANENLEIIQLNDKVVEIAGEDIEQLLGAQPGDILQCLNSKNNIGGCGKGNGCSDCPVRAGLTNVLQTDQPIYNAEVPMEILVDGQKAMTWLCISVVPAIINQRKHLVIAFMDVSERKAGEEKLQKTLAEIERFNSLMEGREVRIIEMKRQVNDLLAELGKSPQYQSVIESNESISQGVHYE